MNNDAVGNMKSTLRGESHMAGNSRGQYDIDGLLTMNKTIAIIVDNDPMTGTSGKSSKQ